MENVLYEETVSGNLVLDYDEKKSLYILSIEDELGSSELETISTLDAAKQAFNKALKFYK